MKIAILGTGTVGTSIATKLVNLGHEIGMNPCFFMDFESSSLS